jgi:hypothetical protein
MTFRIESDSYSPDSFTCVNCDQPIPLIRPVRLYCSQPCSDEAHFVRYFRRCKRDGRIKRRDVIEAIQIKLALILGDGYDAQKRRLSRAERDAVMARDLRVCQGCGKTGTTIDHISGDSNEPDNLQLLCRACHNKKTKSAFVEITSEHPRSAELKAKMKELRSRAEALLPQRDCDNEEQWSRLYHDLMSSRRAATSTEHRLASFLAQILDICDKREIKGPEIEAARALIGQRTTEFRSTT